MNFGSCRPFKENGETMISEKEMFEYEKKRLEKRGFKCEIEAPTPELKAEQLRRIKELK